MAFGLIDKLTNFLMPIEEEAVQYEHQGISERRTHLKVHSPAALKVYITLPVTFDDVRICADCLKSHVAVLINYENLEEISSQQRIGDFLDGICFVTGGTSQRVSDLVTLYVPANIDVSKEMYAYSIPTYVKRKKDF